jgi:hypothetical protein
MKVIAVDPGSRTHGFCYLDSRGKRIIRRFETSHMVQIGSQIYALAVLQQVDVIVVEDFVGQGPRDIHASTTLRMVGFVEGLGHLLGLTVAVQAPQIRKPYLTEAGHLVGPGHHYTDATAHALAYVDLNVREHSKSRRSRKLHDERFTDWVGPADWKDSDDEDVRQVPEESPAVGILEGLKQEGWARQLLHSVQDDSQSE